MHTKLSNKPLDCNEKYWINTKNLHVWIFKDSILKLKLGSSQWSKFHVNKESISVIQQNDSITILDIFFSSSSSRNINKVIVLPKRPKKSIKKDIWDKIANNFSSDEFFKLSFK